jgi:hypothetical protein
LLQGASQPLNGHSIHRVPCGTACHEQNTVHVDTSETYS